ncbi:MAG: hypothetical protein K940chlam7_01877, partial [Chlamydiae bacterium]|nr:hypothetical protein [Chlamydiota bacterium]
EIAFHELANFLQQGDHLIFNDTKVIPARLLGKRGTGGVAEVFITEQLDDGTWYALTRPARKIKPGTLIQFSDSFSCTVLQSLEGGIRRVAFSHEGDFDKVLAEHGVMPLPQYIRRNSEEVDKERYQTVFASNPGAVAAPTAGLHFTKDLLNKLSEEEVKQTHITLHVGAGTFKPVVTEDIREHNMHFERYQISQDAARQLNLPSKGKRTICIGTTCCRTLEAAADSEGTIQHGNGSTDIFIYPGYKFKSVQSLLTNFHLPGSTLLMLVSAFTGHDLMVEAYKKAVKDRFRFYSYGDAMLIL